MRWLALLTLSALGLLLPAAASAKPPLAFLSDSEHGISQAGPYKGVYESPKGTLQIRNARTNTTRSAVMPNGCESRGVSLPAVLLVCYSDYRIWNSLSGEEKVVDISGCGSYARNTSLGGLGRRWIGGQYHTGSFDEYGSEYVRAVYISRATGECRVMGPDDLYRDLDSADLPERHYGSPEKCTKGTRYISRYVRDRLLVKRCVAQAKWRVACRATCGSVNGGRNLLAWAVDDRLHVCLVASGRTLSWRLEGAGYPIVLTDEVYVAATVGHNRPIYTVDLTRLVRR